VIFTSRCGNAFRSTTSHWIVKITYTHAFGTMNERQTLAAELAIYRVCLNQMCGVYLIRIGKVSMLRNAMNISIEQYPANEFNNAFVYKFGRSNDVIRRFIEHCSSNGYGRYSDTIQLTWFVITDSGNDVDAENSVKGFFDDSNRRFEFVDDGGKMHNELVILKQSELADTNMKYQSLIQRYHNSPNELALIMDKARSEYALKLSEEQRLREVAEANLNVAEANLKISEEKRKHDATKAAKDLSDAEHKYQIAETKREAAEQMADLRVRIAQLEASK